MLNYFYLFTQDSQNVWEMCIVLPKPHKPRCCFAGILYGPLSVFSFCASSNTWVVAFLPHQSTLYSYPLINRPWYWWKVIADKWLPMKAPHTPASDSAGSNGAAWLVCPSLSTPVKQFLCLSVGPDLHSIYRCVFLSFCSFSFPHLPCFHQKLVLNFAIQLIAMNKSLWCMLIAT